MPQLHEAHIESLAYVLPPHRVTSKSIEDELAPAYQRIGIPVGVIETLVGVVARKLWDEGEALDDLAARAARLCLDKTGRANEWLDKLGVVISTSVSKDYLEPSVAALVRGRLALGPDCQALDIGNACLGFLNGIEIASQWIALGKVDAALVVAAENARLPLRATIGRLNAPTSTMQDFKEALPTLTLGSGAVAMLVVRGDLASAPHRIGRSVSLGDSATSTICIGTHDSMKTDAQKLLVNGVDLAIRTWQRAEQQLGFTRNNVGQFIAHQVGATHMATLFKKLELDLDKAFLTYPELGNVGPAAIPITLALAVEAGRVKPGDRVALMGIASGLSCMIMEVLW
jgi:3-oxoacyl-[acyl-carrier-protein] synthase-3